MGTDSRIKDLEAEVGEGALAGLLNTLFLAVDESTYTNAKKILLKTILTDAVVSANTNNYQAMTPKAFYDSIMTTTRRGVQRLATDTEVTNRTGEGVVTSGRLELLKNKLVQDFFKQENAMEIFYSAAWSLSWMGNLFLNTLGPGQAMAVSPVAATDLIRASLSLIIVANQTGYQGYLTLQDGMFISLGGGLEIQITANRVLVWNTSSSARTNVRISVTGNAIRTQS